MDSRAYGSKEEMAGPSSSSKVWLALPIARSPVVLQAEANETCASTRVQPACLVFSAQVTMRPERRCL